MKAWSNKFVTGFIIGIFSPPVAFFIFCYIKFYDESAIALIQGYIKRNVLTHIISLSVLINLPLFFGFLGSSREYSSRGVIGATFVYVFVVLILILF